MSIFFAYFASDVTLEHGAPDVSDLTNRDHYDYRYAVVLSTTFHEEYYLFYGIVVLFLVESF